MTHNLIANEAGFETLMQIHDSDKIIDYGIRLKKYAKAKGVFDDIRTLTLDGAINTLSSKYPADKKNWSPTPTQKAFIDSDAVLFEEAKNMPFESIACYVDKDQLLDDKSEEDAGKGTGSKLSPLNHHLHKIEHCIQLYLDKDYNEFMRSTSIKQIVRARQKKELREGITRIISSYNDMTISEVIDLADG
ncbi:DNA helicase, partial [human gut metagenome]